MHVSGAFASALRATEILTDTSGCKQARKHSWPASTRVLLATAIFAPHACAGCHVYLRQPERCAPYNKHAVARSQRCDAGALVCIPSFQQKKQLCASRPSPCAQVDGSEARARASLTPARPRHTPACMQQPTCGRLNVYACGPTCEGLRIACIRSKHNTARRGRRTLWLAVVALVPAGASGGGSGTVSRPPLQTPQLVGS